MKDGANQKVEVGNFCVYTDAGTSTLNLGFVIGFTKQRVTIEENRGWRGTSYKTAKRIIQVPVDVAESMSPKFTEKMKRTMRGDIID